MIVRRQRCACRALDGGHQQNRRDSMSRNVRLLALGFATDIVEGGTRAHGTSGLRGIEARRAPVMNIAGGRAKRNGLE
jgi:hypothetical protein